MLVPCKQLSDARAAEIGNALLATTEGGRMSSVASLQLQVRMLHAVRPVHFGGFRGFARWQQTTAATLSCITSWSTDQYRREQASAPLSCLDRFENQQFCW